VTDISALLASLQAQIGAATSSYTSASDLGDVFEGYVWSIVLAAARSEGASVRFESVSGASPNRLIFRTSPGFIYSKAHDYSHAVILLPNTPELEAHIGVFVTGRSGVTHECDVAVVERDEALLCRAEAVHPRASKVLLALECKFHTSTLQLGLARGFLGLTQDLQKAERFLVTNAESNSAQKMVTYHKAEWEFRLDVSDPSVQANLKARIARTFRNYKAQFGN